jgi:hypothetical protein
LSPELEEQTLASRKDMREGWIHKMMLTSDLHLMEVESHGFQYSEVSSLCAEGVVAGVVAERVAGVAVAGVADVDDVADMVGADDCLGGETSRNPEKEATTHTSRLVCMLGRQMKQSLLECQKRD